MRLQIFKNESIIEKGRQLNKEVLYYECFFDFKDIYGDEFYKAQNIGWTNVVTFKVRYCKKILEMYGSDYQTKFFIKHKDNRYEIKKLDFHNMKKDYVFIKAVMV